MMTFRLDSVLSNVIAQTADSCFSHVLRQERANVALATKHKVRMTCHLTHTGKPVLAQIVTKNGKLTETHKLKILE